MGNYTKGTPYRRHEGIHGDFDVVVIGSGMGGLAIASYLAQDGQKVLLLEQNNIVGGMTQSYSRNGYRWTVGMHYIGEVGSTKGLGWKLFNRVTGGRLRWAPMPSIYNRMVIGGRGYDVPAGAKAYADFLTGHFPGEAQAIQTYLSLVSSVAKSSAPYFAQKALPPAAADALMQSHGQDFLGFARQTTRDALRRLTTNDELIAVLCANWGDYSLEPSQSSFAMHCMLATHYLNGASYPEGGGSAFAEAMVPIIEAAGGRVLHSAEVAEVLLDNDAVQGVRLASGETVACRRVVSNAGVQNTFGRLLHDTSSAAVQAVKAQLTQVKDTYAVVGLNIGFKASHAQLGFTPANVWSHPGPDFEANLMAHRSDFDAPFSWYFISFPSTKDPLWDQHYPGRATVEMYAYTDYRHFADWADTRWMKRGDDYLARKEVIKQRLLSELFRHVPAAAGYVDEVEVSTPLSYETFAKRERGGFMGIASSPQRFEQTWLRPTTPIRGLFLTGQDVATDGVIGALVGATLCASVMLGRDLMTQIRNGD
ncbi:MAG: NAD(P)/FAD-dependent oxidoreductase [Burkholderiales bacterium]